MRARRRRSLGGPSQRARECAREDVRIGCDMLCAVRLARRGGCRGATSKARTRDLVGPGNCDWSCSVELTNWPFLAGTVGNPPALRWSPAECGVHHETLLRGCFVCG